MAAVYFRLCVNRAFQAVAKLTQFRKTYRKVDVVDIRLRDRGISIKTTEKKHK